MVGEPLVGILIGSPSDRGIADKVLSSLAELGVPGEVKVLSAHRTPDLAVAYVSAAEGRGIRVIVACAGMAAHLAGAAAAHTLLPVIGVPVASGPLAGVDALLSTVQMPPGVPVATVAIDGARNAAFLAARILALQIPGVRTALEAARAADREKYDKV
ncbi:MAG: 5-(carboxyamino)imidazole ribonucleotide mutase [Deltaproteobacteria bacterium]|nr:5-(carboxyamino)imidazole ribonucleotide mutase [Deltaproteobacteria bacterium]